MNFKNLLLLGLIEPDYSRLEFWQKQQKESGFSELVFYKKLKDVLTDYESRIETEIAVRNSWGNSITDFQIPLLIETDGLIKGHIGKHEVSFLKLELEKYYSMKISLEQKILYLKELKFSIPFRELEHTVSTVCNWINPILPDIQPSKYLAYFINQIDFEKLENEPTKAETLKYCNAIYFGLEQLLKADINKSLQQFQNSLSGLSKEQIKGIQIELIELIGKLKMNNKGNDPELSFTHRYNLLLKSINSKEKLFDIDFQILIEHFNETVSNDLLSSFEILAETANKIEPYIKLETAENKQGIEQTKTIDKIRNAFIEIDKAKGWHYAFRNENDFNTFAKILALFFEGKDYNLPTQSIFLKKGCKTRFAHLLKELHSDLKMSEAPLKSDIYYLNLVRKLNLFEKDTDIEIYKLMTG